MSKRAVRILAAIMAGLMLLSTVAALVFAEVDDEAYSVELVKTDMPEQLKESIAATAQNTGSDLLASSGSEHEADDMVEVIIELEDQPVLSQSEVNNGDKFSMNASSKKLEQLLELKQDKLIKEISEKVLSNNTIDVRYNYTLAMNAVAATVPYGTLDVIGKMDGVKAVYIDNKCSMIGTKTDNAMDMTGVGMLRAFGDSGFGIGTSIGIIDSGIYAEHEAFSTMPRLIKFKKSSISQKLDSYTLNAEKLMNGLTTDSVYKNAKIPFAFDYASKDTDVSHKDNNGSIADHGTYVAGVAAGLSTSADGAVQFSGVAPYAQLIIMKVFTSDGKGGAQSRVADLIAALEDSVMLGIDVVNMSLGWSGGLTKHTGNAEMEPMDKVMELVKSAGLTVVCAAGNEASSGVGNDTGINKNKIENVDNGTICAPSSYNEVLSVASINNTKKYLPSFNVSISGKDTAIGYLDGMESTKLFASLARSEAYEYVNCGYGIDSDFANKDLTGKIAVVQRGNIAFVDKINNAASAGAVGVIIYNNVAGELQATTAEDTKLPAAYIDRASGISLVNNTGKKEIIINANNSYVGYSDGGYMSYFSSWGVPADLSLKPDITAPGGNVVSSSDPSISGSEYNLNSGTSMSSPHVAGAIALLRSQYSETRASMTAVEFSEFAMSQLISTAIPQKDSRGFYYSPRLQGAGLIDVYSASLARLQITVPNSKLPKLELGDDPNKTGVYTMEFTVKNISTEANEFIVDTTVLTEMLEDEMFIAQRSLDITSQCSISTGLTDNKFSLAAGASKKITVKATLSSAIKSQLDLFTSGIYIDGFVRLYSTNEVGAYAYTVPYLAFYGDWDMAPMLDKVDYTDILLDERTKSVTTHPNSALLAREDLNDKVFYLGDNPVWGKEARYSELRNAISPDGDGYYDDLNEIYLNLLRSAKTIDMTVKNTKTGEKYFNTAIYAQPKTIYDTQKGEMKPYILVADGMIDPWAGTDASGGKLANDTECTVTITAQLGRDGYDPADNINDTWTFPITIDTQAPNILSAVLRKNGAKTELVMKVSDNQFVADVLVCDTSDAHNQIDRVMCAETARNAVTEVTIDVTSGYSDLYLVVTDYAWNQSVYRIGTTESVKIDQGESSVRMGDTLLLTASTYSANGNGYMEPLEWMTSDPSIAEVDVDTGLVIPISIGDVEITVTTLTTNKSDTVTVHVVDASAIITPKPGTALQLTQESGYIIDASYLYNVAQKTTAADVLSNFVSSGSIVIVNSSGTQIERTATVGTGYKVRLMSGTAVVSEVSIVILGDITGDGQVNSRDIASLQRHVIGSQTLTDVYFMAANLNGDSALNSRDIAALQRLILQ